MDIDIYQYEQTTNEKQKEKKPNHLVKKEEDRERKIVVYHQLCFWYNWCVWVQSKENNCVKKIYIIIIITKNKP